MTFRILPILILTTIGLAWISVAGISVADEPSLSEIRHPKEVDFPPVQDTDIVRYTALRTAGPIKLDGQLTEPSWKAAKASPPFVDLVSGKPTLHDTRVKILWDDRYLYVGYEIEEPKVRAKFLKRDAPIWQDNDIELFIAFDHAYYELEVNAHATLYEGLFVWQEAYEKKGFSQLPELNIQRPGVRHQKFNAQS